MTDKALVKLAEMAELLSIHPETLRGYYLSGRVRGYKLPANDSRGKLRFDPDEVRADLRAGNNDEAHD
jgi:predicted site-specific integrase-resolvase